MGGRRVGPLCEMGEMDDKGEMVVQWADASGGEELRICTSVRIRQAFSVCPLLCALL